MRGCVIVFVSLVCESRVGCVGVWVRAWGCGSGHGRARGCGCVGVWVCGCVCGSAGGRACVGSSIQARSLSRKSTCLCVCVCVFMFVGGLQSLLQVGPFPRDEDAQNHQYDLVWDSDNSHFRLLCEPGPRSFPLQIQRRKARVENRRSPTSNTMRSLQNTEHPKALKQEPTTPPPPPPFAFELCQCINNKMHKSLYQILDSHRINKYFTKSIFFSFCCLCLSGPDIHQFGLTNMKLAKLEKT